MTHQLYLARELDEGLWRDFVETHPHGTIFHTPEMFQVFSQTRGYEPKLWAVVDDDKRPLALFLPVTITLMPGLLSRFTSRAIVHGSVLCAPGVRGRQALDLLLPAYKQGTNAAVLFTELRNLADVSELHPILNAHNFTYEEHLNYLIDLDRPACQVLQSIGKRTRKKIRKGLRDGHVSLDEVTDRSELALWYEILAKTYDYAKVPLVDRSLFEAVFDQLCPKNMARFVLARVQGTPAACSLELLYRDTIYGWYGGIDRTYSSDYPNELMHWHILEWGVDHGYRSYDFGGAGSPAEDYGVRDFKAKFGGELVSFGRYAFVHSPNWLKMSEMAYNLYRRIL